MLILECSVVFLCAVTALRTWLAFQEHLQAKEVLRTSRERFKDLESAYVERFGPGTLTLNPQREAFVFPDAIAVQKSLSDHEKFADQQKERRLAEEAKADRETTKMLVSFVEDKEDES